MLLGSGSPGNSSNRLWAPDEAMLALLEANPTAVAVLDPHGNIAYRNAAWRDLGTRTASYGDLGTLVAAGDHEGSPYLRRLAALDGPLALPARRLARAAQDALAGRAHEARTPYRIRRPEGEEPFEALLVPLPTPKATLLAIQHVALGDREHAADAEAVALEKALQVEEAASRQRRLVRRMQALGRDLHTPITPVRLELHLLHNGSLGPLTPAQDKAIEVMRRNVQRWADREAAFQGLPVEPPAPATTFDLAALVADAVEARQTEALQQGVRLAGPGQVPSLMVHASPDDLRDVLDRFLDHALAVSTADSVVTVEAGRRGDEAHVAVLDAGPGLSARELRTAFEPWGGKRPDRGASLSLHVARLTIEKAGGRAWAESDGPGQGLLLGLGLPLAQASTSS